MANEEMVYYKKNINNTVVVRLTPRDRQGVALTRDNPFVAVPVNGIRDFKIANKMSIINGVIIPVPEPSVDWETDNAIDDELALNLVKGNFLSLKKSLEKITAVPILEKMLELAKENDRPKKTLTLIEARLAEVSEDDDFITPEDMRGVETPR